MRPENPSLDLGKFAELDPKQKLIHLIKFALLAPSSHNTQPWLFKLAGPAQIEVLANPDRALKHSDPTGRELYISIGAAVQNLIAAAEYFGYETRLEINGDTHSHLAVRLGLSTAAGKASGDSRHAKAILTRHNNRFAYQNKMPEQRFLDWVLRLEDDEVQIKIIVDPQQKERVVRIVGQAIESSLDEHAFRQELAGWLRSRSNKHKDGMTADNLGLPKIPFAILSLAMRKFRMGKPQRRQEEKSLKATPVFVIISTPSDSKYSWIKCGMTLEKIALAAEALGIAVGINAAAIETKEFYKELQKAIGSNGRPQVFCRIGYSSKIPKQSPRLGIQELVRS